MGNTSSSVPQPAVAGGSGKNHDDGSSSGGSSSVFRLPLYRGERDAFLPIIDDCTVEYNGDNASDFMAGGDPHDRRRDGTSRSFMNQQRKNPLQHPPLLSVEPKLSNSTIGNQQLIISPLGVDISVNTTNDNDNEGGPSPDSSPPSVISSSDSSHGTWSYGTCHSTLTSPPNNAYSNSNNNNQPNRHRPLLPIHLPKPVPKRDPNSKKDVGVFDCVKRQVAKTAAHQNKPLTRKKSAASLTSLFEVASLTSLFQSCLRPADDGNEYTNEDDSENGSSYPSTCHYRRSVSVGSQGSNSRANSHSSNNHSHNPHHLTKTTSRASLASSTFFSTTSQLSFSTNTYTEEETNMPNGDEPTHQSDLRDIRNYHVVTTAALPWRTGTAVNPLLRAAYLLRRNGELRRERNARQEEGHEKEVDILEASDTKEDDQISLTDAKKTTYWLRRKVKMKMKQDVDNAQDGTHGSNFDIPNDKCASLNADEHKEPPTSPCSLDYSCFSFSEIDNTTHTPGNKYIDNPTHARDVISPLEEDDDSLLLSPFTPCEATVEARIVPRSDVPKEHPKHGKVTLVVPWLQDGSDRSMLYGNETEVDDGGEMVPLFADREEQEVFIRRWLAKEAGMPVEARELDIVFYPARYHKFYNSIFALGDICDLIPDEIADVCILEEPEHLNWYRAPGCDSWSSKFCHCIGVIHTNYKAYARDHAPAGFLAAPLLAGVNSLVVQANCHRVVKLSGVLQEFAPMSECIENVHGIRETFLNEGRRRRMSTIPVNEKGRAYFIGKLLWAKGFDQLLELEATFRERTGEYFEIDIFGAGPDEREIQRAYLDDNDDESGILNSIHKWSGSSSRDRCQSRLPANFLGPSDHSSLVGDAYSIFINPSLTEVLCTTTAEAIAMGKWAIVPSHPSNAFFTQFPNCLSYRNRREFVSTLKYAQTNDPPQLSEELARLLSWEAATMRCVRAAAISKRDAARNERISRMREEKTLKKTFSGLWNGSKGDFQTMNVHRMSSSSSSLERTTGDVSIGLVTP